MTVKEQLIAARAKIEAGWTQHEFARDVDGNSLGLHPKRIDFSKAACVCMSGALEAVGAEGHVDGLAYEALRAHTSVILSTWNDDKRRTKEEVLAVFDKAIAAQA
jgi:hypothetical protein